MQGLEKGLNGSSSSLIKNAIQRNKGNDFPLPCPSNLFNCNN